VGADGKSGAGVVNGAGIKRTAVPPDMLGIADTRSSGSGNGQVQSQVVGSLMPVWKWRRDPPRGFVTTWDRKVAGGESGSSPTGNRGLWVELKYKLLYDIDLAFDLGIADEALVAVRPHASCRDEMANVVSR
jgi:hypothetical protein